LINSGETQYHDVLSSGRSIRLCKLLLQEQKRGLAWFDTNHYLSLLWKESLNSDGKQFHQEQQNEYIVITSQLYSLNTEKDDDI